MDERANETKNVSFTKETMELLSIQVALSALQVLPKVDFKLGNP